MVSRAVLPSFEINDLSVTFSLSIHRLQLMVSHIAYLIRLTEHDAKIPL